MVARCFPGGNEGMRAEGFEPPRAVKLRGFSYRLRLSPPWRTALGSRDARFAVWTIPSPCPGLKPGVRCCPSSLYTFPVGLRPGLARDRHARGFPEFGQFCIARFRASTQVFLKSAASAIPPRPLSDDGCFRSIRGAGVLCKSVAWGPFREQGRDE